MNLPPLIFELIYLVSSVCFIFGLKYLASPETARRGMRLAELGMLAAIVGTMVQIVDFGWVLAGLAVGSAAGAAIAVWTPMTAMPQRTALSHAFGALAAALVGFAEFYRHPAAHWAQHRLELSAIGFECLLGALTFTGSMMAFAKLQELMRGAPMTYKGQNVVNMATLATAVGLMIYVIINPEATTAFYAMIALALLFGVMLILPIGAADMPTVISLLNSYAGLAASATGFALSNKVLIIAGALDGASGVVLSVIMCRAMNRSMLNVLFGAFGQAPAAAAQGGPVVTQEIQKTSIDEAAGWFRAAKLVIVVPGYGMAAAQAQHGVREFADGLKALGVKVRHAIHPVAGRMPGHMNVLLAEASVPYDELVDMDEINPDFPRADVVLVMGANDVTNPAAKRDPTSPIYGMPILDVESAKRVIVCKRGMSPGFAGIDNLLYALPNCWMLFGDAKGTAEKLARAIERAPLLTAPSAEAPESAGRAPRAQIEGSESYDGGFRSATAAELAPRFREARRVVIVPGYGMAVAQSALCLRDLMRLLETLGVNVRVALHPVAGRMPGHMNISLAEADVGYEKILDPEEIHGALREADLVLVVGANDVVNPSAGALPGSPLSGLGVFDLSASKCVVVIKRSLRTGYAELRNPLFSEGHCTMLFADGKAGLVEIARALQA